MSAKKEKLKMKLSDLTAAEQAGLSSLLSTERVGGTTPGNFGESLWGKHGRKNSHYARGGGKLLHRLRAMLLVKQVDWLDGFTRWRLTALGETLAWKLSGKLPPKPRKKKRGLGPGAAGVAAQIRDGIKATKTNTRRK